MVREDTRARIVAATLTTLKERGFAGTSTRAIARAGGFGQPLIFYYFDSLDELLIVALEESSTERPELAPRVVALMGPWVELARSAVERVLTASGAEGLGGAVSSRELALAGVTFYLGANLLAHLEPAW